jgi:hypothetical protein
MFRTTSRGNLSACFKSLGASDDTPAPGTGGPSTPSTTVSQDEVPGTGPVDTVVVNLDADPTAVGHAANKLTCVPTWPALPTMTDLQQHSGRVLGAVVGTVLGGGTVAGALAAGGGPAPVTAVAGVITGLAVGMMGYVVGSTYGPNNA